MAVVALSFFGRVSADLVARESKELATSFEGIDLCKMEQTQVDGAYAIAGGEEAVWSSLV